MTEPKRHVLVKSGKVIDLVIPGPGYEPPKGAALIESDTANIGDLYDGNKFTPFEKLTSKAELKDILWIRRRSIITDGIEVNFAEPGEEPNVVKIPTNDFYRDEIRDLAWLAEATGEDTTLVIRDVGPGADLVLTLTPKQIMMVRERIAEHIRRAHRISAKLLEGIDSARIASPREIQKPELATAIKIDPWKSPHV